MHEYTGPIPFFVVPILHTHNQAGFALSTLTLTGSLDTKKVPILHVGPLRYPATRPPSLLRLPMGGCWKQGGHTYLRPKDSNAKIGIHVPRHRKQNLERYDIQTDRLELYTVSQKKLSRFVFVRTASNFHRF